MGENAQRASRWQRPQNGQRKWCEGVFYLGVFFLEGIFYLWGRGRGRGKRRGVGGRRQARHHDVIISLTVEVYPASSRRERRRTCSHQNGRKN